MTETKFFIYGSLCEGFVHFARIQDFILHSQPATITGSIYRLKVGYPVLVKEGADVIPGCFIELQSSELLLSLLDEFHGHNRHDESKSLYIRELCTVRKSDGALVQAWTYYLNPKKLPTTARLISGGDWKSAFQLSPPMTEALTEKQRQYVQRLGSTTGREIVPIDLGLYRELMNLELIVDKGRRLALSKLGQEVYRYLS